MPTTNETAESLKKPEVGQKLRWRSSIEPGPKSNQAFCNHLLKKYPGELKVVSVVEPPQRISEPWQLQISCDGKLIESGFGRASQFSPYWVHLEN